MSMHSDRKPLNRPGDIFFLNDGFPPTAEEMNQ